MTIRVAEVADLEALLDLRAAVAAEGDKIGAEAPIDRDGDRSRFRAELEHGPGRIVVAVADGRVVGSASVIPRYGIGEVGICISAEWRGQGLGSELLEDCIEWARRESLHKMSLQVWPDNVAAIALYSKYGFVREGYLTKQWRRRNGELWDSVLMGLVLTQ